MIRPLYCKQCSLTLFDTDFEDYKGFTTEDEWRRGFAQLVECESCGTIQVDPEGNCVSPACLRTGQKGHGLPWLK